MKTLSPIFAISLLSLLISACATKVNLYQPYSGEYGYQFEFSEPRLVKLIYYFKAGTPWQRVNELTYKAIAEMAAQQGAHKSYFHHTTLYVDQQSIGLNFNLMRRETPLQMNAGDFRLELILQLADEREPALDLYGASYVFAYRTDVLLDKYQ